MESSNGMKNIDEGVGEESATAGGGESSVGEDTSAKSEKSTIINDQQTANESVDLLRGWDNTPDDIPPPIDYSTLDEDETPYEHNFEPGDHVIRWDMLVSMYIWYIIQLHYIFIINSHTVCFLFAAHSLAYSNSWNCTRS